MFSAVLIGKNLVLYAGNEINSINGKVVSTFDLDEIKRKSKN